MKLCNLARRRIARRCRQALNSCTRRLIALVELLWLSAGIMLLLASPAPNSRAASDLAGRSHD
jgi:hypothetical protein